MFVKKEIDFEDLKEMCWSGAINTLQVIEDNNKQDEFMRFLEEEYQDIPTITEVNDLLWFNENYIFDMLNIETESDKNER